MFITEFLVATALLPQSQSPTAAKLKLGNVLCADALGIEKVPPIIPAILNIKNENNNTSKFRNFSGINLSYLKKKVYLNSDSSFLKVV